MKKPPPSSDDADCEIRFIGEMQKLKIKPNDRFVLHSDVKWSREDLEQFDRIWKKFIGNTEAKILVLPKGTKLGVIEMGEENES